MLQTLLYLFYFFNFINGVNNKQQNGISCRFELKTKIVFSVGRDLIVLETGYYDIMSDD